MRVNSLSLNLDENVSLPPCSAKSISSSYFEGQRTKKQKNPLLLSPASCNRIGDVKDAALKVFSFKSNDEGKFNPYHPSLHENLIAELRKKDLLDNFNKDLNKINEDLSKINKKIDANNKFITETKEYKNNFDQVVKIIDSNIEFFFGVFRTFIKTETDYDTISDYLDVKENFIKVISGVAILMEKSLPFYHTYQCQKELEQSQKELERMKENHKEVFNLFSDSVNDLLSKIEGERKRISSDYEVCKDSIKKLLAETALYVIVPLIVSFIVISLWSRKCDSKKIGKLFKLTFKVFKKISKIKDCFENLKIKQKWQQDLQPPEKIEENEEPSFKFMQDHKVISIKTLLNQKKVELKNKAATISISNEFLEANLPSKLQSLEELLIRPKQENFEEFLTQFYHAGFIVDNENNLRQHWINGSFSRDYEIDICKQSLRADLVKHQLTIAQLLKQGTQVAVSKKIDVENHLLIFDFFKLGIELIYTIAQMTLIVPYLGKILAKSGGEIFLNLLKNNLPITGIHFLYFLNPDLDLSVFGFFSKGLSHLWNHHYKPNEYSCKGYWNDSKTKWAPIEYSFWYLAFNSCKLFIKLIDVFIKLFLNINYFISCQEMLDKALEKNKENYENKLKNLEQELNELKKLDIQQTLNPHFSKNLNGYKELWAYLVENDCPKQLLKKINIALKNQNNLDAINEEIDNFLQSNHLFSQEKILRGETKYQLDHLQVIIETLESANLDLFPEEVVNFFKENVNVEFEKDMREQLEKLFIANGKTFFKFHKEASASAKTKPTY